MMRFAALNVTTPLTDHRPGGGVPVVFRAAPGTDFRIRDPEMAGHGDLAIAPTAEAPPTRAATDMTRITLPNNRAQICAGQVAQTLDPPDILPFQIDNDAKTHGFFTKRKDG